MDLSNLLMQHMMLGQLKNYYNPNRNKQIETAAGMTEGQPQETVPQPQEQQAQPIRNQKAPITKQLGDGSFVQWDDYNQTWIPVVK